MRRYDDFFERRKISSMARVYMQSEDLFATSASLLGKLQRDPRDPEAWQRFIAVYLPKIVEWCRQSGAKGAEVEKTANDVVSRFFERITRTPFVYDPSKKFRAYLKAMARNAWLDWRTQSEKGVGGSTILQRLHQVEAAEDLEQKIEQAFDLELLHEAMRRVQLRLPEEHWTAYRLHVLENRPVAEVAAAVGIQQGMVYVRKNRINEMLRKEIAQLESE